MRNAATTKRRPASTRSRRLSVDPYLVTPTTWTRDELLRARGWEPKRRAPVGRGHKAA